MSFTAATCITETGTQPLGELIEIYTDVDSYSTLLSAVTISQLTTNCPLFVEVPDGTTKLKVFDPETTCFYIITLQSNDICGDCELGFDSVDNNQISTILIGNLTGSCETPITDYRIEWYGPDSSTNLAFTSGEGTEFPYLIDHPITTSSQDAPLLLQGDYLIRLTNVRVNDVNFSYSGQPDTVPSNSLFDCFDLIDVDGVELSSISVSAYTCNNGGGPYNTYYEHQKSFTTTGDGSTPKPLGATFSLSAGTDTFIWEFFGYTVYDTLKLTFSGASYSEPLVLEDIRVGDNTSTTDFDPTIFPKLTSSQSYKKITNLSGLTVNDGDEIIIEITPNESQNNTSWMLNFGCYGQPTAEKNCLDTYKNQSYKIKKDSIVVGTPNSCGSFYIDMSYSGCSANQNSGFTQSDLAALSSPISIFQIQTDNTTNLLSRRFETFTSGTTYLQWGGPGLPSICMSTTGNVIKITKTVGQLSFFFNDLNDLTGYTSSFYSLRNNVTGQTSTYGGVFINDNSTLEYFRMVELFLPSSSVVESSVCDTLGISWDAYQLHVTTTVTTGTTSGGWYLNFIMPSIVNNFTGCTSCYLECPERIDTMISQVNSFYNTTFSERTYTNGLRYGNPFFDSEFVRKLVSSPTTAATVYGFWVFYTSYNLNTYPSSGNTNTLIPSLSSTTWDFQSHSSSINTYGPIYNASVYSQDLYYTTVEITSTTPTIEFKIYSKPITNWMATGSLIEIYDSTNPTVFNSDYMY